MVTTTSNSKTGTSGGASSKNAPATSSTGKTAAARSAKSNTAKKKTSTGSPSNGTLSAISKNPLDNGETAKKTTVDKPDSNGTTETKATTKAKAKTDMATKKKSKAVASKKKKEAAEKLTPVDKLLNEHEHLKNAVQQIEKQFGNGSIMALGDDYVSNIRGISTGSLSLDIALGGQGLPCGRIIEIYGPESSGKTTLALHAIAEAQKKGGVAAFIDAEHAFDPTWARKLGVQLDMLLVSQPNSGEEAMQIVEMLVKSNSVDVIVVDSVAALVPKRELEGEIGDSHVGLQARLMSQSMRKLTGVIAKSKTCTIFINQIREKVGVMFGSPETTPGGRALKFYSSVRIDVRRIGALKDGDQQVGQRVKTKIVKNKVAPPFRVAEFDMMHSCGISYQGDVLDLGVAHKIVIRSGAWFKYGSTHLGQGKEKARNFLLENPDICEEIRGKIMEAGGYVEVDDKLDENSDGADLPANTF